VNKPILVAVDLAVFMAASAYAQTTDFFELVKTGTPQSVQAAFDQGTDVNAQNKDHRTVLMYAAAYNQNPEVITALLKASADLKA
jgi:ankyrin repeat protein